MTMAGDITRSPVGGPAGSAVAVRAGRHTLPRPAVLGSLCLLLPVTACSLVAGGEDELRPPGSPPTYEAIEGVVAREVTWEGVARGMEALRSGHVRDPSSTSRRNRAAAWVAARLQMAGLEPAGEDGGYIQYAFGTPGGSPDAPNVVALLPGADPERAGEYVVVVARLGQPVEPDTGDDDRSRRNLVSPAEAVGAATTAAMVEAGRVLATLPVRPARPVLFLAVSGDEADMGGAAWFARHPTVSLTQAVAVLALGGGLRGATADGMVAPGLGDDGGGDHAGGWVQVVGHGHSSLGAVLSAVSDAHPALGLVVRSAGAEADAAYFPGDHLPFARHGTPAALLVFDPAQPGPQEWDEIPPADVEAAVRLARLLVLTVHRIASADARPIWTEAGRRAIRGR